MRATPEKEGHVRDLKASAQREARTTNRRGTGTFIQISKRSKSELALFLNNLVF
jgi:hypothetical protein